ncbi:MAG: sigma-70 family RNA polymerase sigma factor [Eubacterium sp.]|nr:sigma-70 family RNA polymerase sigma factor [Eubacterium sp.]
MRDADLITALKERKEHAMEELLSRYSPLIRYVIAPILPSGYDQEECISEVAMRVWEKVELYDEHQGSWTGWLTSMARNVALNRARGQRQHQPLEAIHMEIPSKEPTPEERVLQKEQQMELRKALQMALRELSAADTTLFYRKYYYLQSTAQIAAEMGLSERAVEGRLYRIKKRLRKKLGGDVYE